MRIQLKKNQVLFLGAFVGFIVVVQILISVGLLSNFWITLLRIGAVMAIVSLGLNLIYGFNGQFSLGQWGFYAIGAYIAGDITYRWTQQSSASGLIVLLLAVLLIGLAVAGINAVLTRVRGLDPLSSFTLYLIGVLFAVWVAAMVGRTLIEPVSVLLRGLPNELSTQIVFFFAVLIAAGLAAETSYLFGIPVLTLGSDYFGIATLGFTIIIKVLLDNSDTMLGLEEMKGARGMIGIPKVGSWMWIALFLFVVVIVTRNLLHSSQGRAIVSVRENELAGKAMGIDVAQQKITAFVIGSFFAGLAGALYAHINGFLHPNTFNFIRSFDPMIIIVFGGLGSVSGTLVASFAWALVLEGLLRLVLPEGFETWRFVVYPLLLLLLMILRPKGLLGGFEFPFIRQELPPLRRREPALQPEVQPGDPQA